MKQASLKTIIVALGIALLGASSAIVSISLPPDTTQTKTGPNAALVTGNCTACHSSSYIYTQPRLTRDQWTAEVKKMKAVYAAPVDDKDIDPIVDYLVAVNGK